MYAPNFTKLQQEDGSVLCTGWKPRYPDRRDFGEDSPQVKPYIDKLSLGLTIYYLNL